MLGPFTAYGNKLSYTGNEIFNPISDVKVVKPGDVSKRFYEIKDNPKWAHIINIYDSIHTATFKFMKRRGSKLFDLPITTRMISSPGALTKTIISDVEPFEVNFFNEKLFLSQSSQLYLEFAIMPNNISEVYCWDKSFRKEPADFRHLPEFTHVEFESRINFEKNLEVQVQYLKFLIRNLIENNLHDLIYFLNEDDINDLKNLTNRSNFERITFTEAFNLLYKETRNSKYKNITIKNFGFYEEILLTQIRDNKPIFITNFIEDEVAFYHTQKMIKMISQLKILIYFFQVMEN